MAKNVIMPALGMAQDTGTLIRWLKAAGEAVTQGEPLMEIETDKATVEVEAPASGVLANVTARPGDVVPVGNTIAVIMAPGEASPAAAPGSAQVKVDATPIAARVAAEHRVDLAQVKPEGGRVSKEDVLAFVAAQAHAPDAGPIAPVNRAGLPYMRPLASTKARRMAQVRGLDLRALTGSGPEGAVLAADVLAAAAAPVAPSVASDAGQAAMSAPFAAPETVGVSRLWRVMAERVTQAWTTIPHFYLIREVNAARLIAWRDDVLARSPEKVSYTDLLVKLAAAALRRHPRLNAAWRDGTVVLNPDINIGLAVALDDGLVVPVIHYADQLSLSQLAARRAEIVGRAKAGKLSLGDLSGGTFTLSNLGMYEVDAFNAIVNPPQAAILAVGRIADRVVPVGGQPAVQPMMVFSLSCDHRVVDGARGAQFLQTLAGLVEEPMRLLD